MHMDSSNFAMQSEASECGLTCVAMIASAHGMHVGLPELRRRFPLSMRGARLNQVVQIAERLGLSARALRVNIHQLSELQLLCILHWDLNHFVVLARVP